MKNKLTVMVPVDFSPVSFKALEFLGMLLKQTPIDTHLVHVIQVNAADWAGSSEASETLDRAELQAREQQARQQFQELSRQVGFPFSSHLLHGGLTSVLADFANRQPIDLVIMGTRGSEGWLEKVSGSEAQQVVRHTQVPVITIHQQASLTPIRHILWVADFQDRQQPPRAVAAIKTLQQLFGARLHLLHILDKAEEAQAQHIQQGMEQFAQRLQLADYELHLRRDHQVPNGVTNFNRESDMDLVLIGTHARKGLRQLFHGSIAETLVNHCIRPLMTYHLQP